MDKETMKKNLLEKAEVLGTELVSLEQQFNQKKEQFVKIQGALEALNELED
jgi:chaperonin cofactor prefoldin